MARTARIRISYDDDGCGRKREKGVVLCAYVWMSEEKSKKKSTLQHKMNSNKKNMKKKKTNPPLNCGTTHSHYPHMDWWKFLCKIVQYPALQQQQQQYTNRHINNNKKNTIQHKKHKYTHAHKTPFYFVYFVHIKRKDKMF